MVKKSALIKLSDAELEKYVKDGNRFVPEAIEIAMIILEERGRLFTEKEKAKIQQIIQHKKQVEEDKLNEERELWKDHITEDPNAIRLYSRELILIISLFLGSIPGSILLALNFIKLKKNIPAALTLIFGFIFLPIQNFLVPFIYENTNKNFFTYKYSPEFFVSSIGSLILLVFWVTFTPKKLPYKAKSPILPIIISLIILYLIIINYQNWFSSYFLVSFAK
ncbi:hypothetical protein [Chryseobacterium oryctis]|uniref:Uncharacterized protein n=1 Tax=Chryseobacterium oryctis TaxID=2952618 RepID=A0ABT3HS44_9FLAO|nr:hypothetical protein [Chryseobacterium oryctis]MCW3162603.1 hypothetical protein [Chryseobacterium oryctis]